MSKQTAADQLQAALAAVEAARQSIVAEHEEALAEYRKDTSDEAAYERYKAAQAQLVAMRQEERKDRPVGVNGIVADEVQQDAQTEEGKDA